MSKFIRFISEVEGSGWYKDITEGKLYQVAEGDWPYIVDDKGCENDVYTDYPFCYEVGEEPSNKRPHYDLRIAHANGDDIEEQAGDGSWYLQDTPNWSPNACYRIAIPKAPERVFPLTSLTGDELNKIYCANKVTFKENLVLIANAAIKRFVEDTENEE